jgi:hypothetical protein
MPTPPTPQQRKKLQDALISAFPERSLLEQLLDYELDEKLNLITQDSNLQTVVYKIIQRAQAEEWLIELVSAARKKNPGNSELAAVALELLREKLDVPTQFSQLKNPEADYEYDVFISHASEDKDSFVRCLAKQLRDRGYRVWYDEFSLRMGDSLRRSIDYGLANTRYGIVVISPNFLKKEWPQRELDGLAAREVDGKKIILPIWHQLEREDVVKHSPTLADKLAVKTSEGMNYVVSQIVKVLEESSISPVRGDKTAPTTTTNFFERIFQFGKLSTRQPKILVLSTALVLVFVPIAGDVYYLTHSGTRMVQPTAQATPSQKKQSLSTALQPTAQATPSQKKQSLSSPSQPTAQATPSQKNHRKATPLFALQPAQKPRQKNHRKATLSPKPAQKPLSSPLQPTAQATPYNLGLEQPTAEATPSPEMTLKPCWLLELKQERGVLKQESRVCEGY